MRDLNVFGMYEENNKQVVDEFFENVDSNFNLKVESKDVIHDTEWIEIVENTIQYIDNILRNPNRFIINEEDIVKIELARKITVESIKHLSRNTNLIQDYNKESGEVRPSKILNINKEESYDTYENKLVYTLIQNLKVFIMKKKGYIENSAGLKRKENKDLEYFAKTKILGEDVDMKIQLNSNLDSSEDAKNEYEEIMKRIENLERKITDVSCSEVYKILEKKHLALITPPIKKTNVILKNVNFQYVMKLWNYLQDNLENKTTQIDNKDDFSDDENLKKVLDENFLLNYLVINDLNKNKEKSKEIQELTREKLTNQLIEKLISLNSDLTQEEILEMIGIKYNAVVEKTTINLKDIKKIFEKHINKYLERISE